MERIPEPELMDEPGQARAYAEADFEEPHNRFVSLFRERFGGAIDGTVLDLGCGPGDISMRFARAYPGCEVHGLDGAEAMLALGRGLVADSGLAERVRLLHGYLPEDGPPGTDYGVLISNSLLHHLHDPMVLWSALKEYGRTGAALFVMDLMRPSLQSEARAMMEAYAGDEPEVLQHDFYHSLLAAYEEGEVREQLRQAGLAHLTLEVVSDRHLIVWGRL